MCMFSIETQTDLTPTERKVIDMYRLITDIPCYVLHENTDYRCAASTHEKCDLICYESLGYSNFKKDFNKMIKFNQALQKPYVFFCHPGYILWSVEYALGDNDSVLFIAGPVRTTQTLEDTKSDVNSTPIHIEDNVCDGLKMASQIPVLSANKIDYASQLLYDLVQYQFSSSKTISNTNTIINEKTIAEDLSNPLLSLDKDKDKIKSLTIIDAQIKAILQCASGDLSNDVTDIFHKIIKPAFYMSDIDYSLAYIIGMASLLGQAVASSLSFLYSKKLFLLYSRFIKDVADISDQQVLYDVSITYFNSFFNELKYNCIKGEENSIVRKIMEYININISQDIGLKQIAGELHFDQSYMCRVFKSSTGITIKNYLDNARILLASKMLSETNESITVIARKVGINNATVFKKMFKENFGLSPFEYRKIMNT